MKMEKKIKSKTYETNIYIYILYLYKNGSVTVNACKEWTFQR